MQILMIVSMKDRKPNIVVVIAYLILSPSSETLLERNFSLLDTFSW